MQLAASIPMAHAWPQKILTWMGLCHGLVDFKSSKACYETCMRMIPSQVL